MKVYYSPDPLNVRGGRVDLILKPESPKDRRTLDKARKDGFLSGTGFDTNGDWMHATIELGAPTEDKKMSSKRPETAVTLGFLAGKTIKDAELDNTEPEEAKLTLIFDDGTSAHFDAGAYGADVLMDAMLFDKAGRKSMGYSLPPVRTGDE